MAIKIMEILIQILVMFGQTVFEILGGVWQAIIILKPSFDMLNKLSTTFTPIGIISLYLGVPAVMISAVVKIVKKALWQRDNY